MASITRRDAPLRLNIHSLRSSYEKFNDPAIRMHQAARWYAENGFHIVPFVDYGDGKVGYPKGVSQRHATRSLDKIDEWWHPVGGRCPGAVIAMAHGGKSGFCAVDLDVKANINGMETLADLIMAYGDYNDGTGGAIQTLMAVTPTGGRHLVFRYHPEIISNSEISYEGIDTRGGLKRNPAENGGITFVEPSTKPGSSNPITYKWDTDGPDDIIDMPQWLVDVLNGRPPKRGGIQLQDEYVQSAMGLHGAGRDRNIYGDLLRFVGVGYGEKELWDLLPQIVERMDPPDEHMVRRKIESVLESDAFKKQQIETERRTKADTLQLDRNDKGHVLRTAKNLNIILRSAIFEHDFGYIQYDEFHHHFVIDKKPLAMVGDWAYFVCVWMSENLKVEYGTDVIRKAVETIAYSSQHANAAREYMFSCPIPSPDSNRDPNFMGSGRLGPGPVFKRLCTEVLDLSNPELHPGYDEGIREAYEAFLWFWLQGVCARACVPGCKMEMMLNIFGSQGIGKSTFFKDLCPTPAWFTDSIKDAIVDAMDNKDELSKLHGCLIAELPELSPIKKGGKSSDDKFKQFISSQKDKFRAPFGKDTMDYFRTCAMAGTSNNRDVYRDVTGDRRFLSIDHGKVSIKLGDLDKGVLRSIRNQLWGEIRSSFNEGELDQTRDPNDLLVCIPASLREIQANVNRGHKYEEPGMREILDWAEGKTRFSYDELYAEAATTPGLRGMPNNQLTVLLRKILGNSGKYIYKRSIKRKEPDGTTKKSNYWVNLEHPLEQDRYTYDESPDHWSKQNPPPYEPEEY